MRKTLALSVLTALAAFGQQFFSPALPALPQATVDTTLPVQTGKTTVVYAGGDLQGAINNAQRGDTIMIDATGTFVGNFVLPPKSGTGWVVITTTATTALPPPGTRAGAAKASAMPKILTPNYMPAIATQTGATGYRLIGLEVTLAPNVSLAYSLVCFGQCDGSSQNSSNTPSNLILDRSYVHGGALSQSVRRGVVLNGQYDAVVESEVSGCWYPGYDSQAILGWDGPGPHLIRNNDLQAASENIDFGGAMPTSNGLVPSDITIIWNHIWKPLSWQGAGLNTKNLLEVKSGRRIRVEGNLFENCWEDGQQGTAVLFTVRTSQSGSWAVDDDITFIYNVIQHTSSGIETTGYDGLDKKNSWSTSHSHRFLFENNLMYDLNSAVYGGSGRLFQIYDKTTGVTIRHNTGLASDVTNMTQVGDTDYYYYAEDNIFAYGKYGLLNGLSNYVPWYFNNNVLFGAGASGPSGNFYPQDETSVGFTDPANNNYTLLTTSSYAKAATDGTDLGVDTVGLSNALGGQLPPPLPPPPALKGLTLASSSIAAGQSVLLTATLNQPAATGGTVHVTSSNPAVAWPASDITIAPGASVGSVEILTAAGGSRTTVTLTGTYLKSSATVDLLVTNK